MGTTVVAAIADCRRLTIAHIGDSRAYMLRGEQLAQLTDDHSLVNELVKSGADQRRGGERSPRRNVLTRALGTEERALADIRHMEWQTGDTCCSAPTGYQSAGRAGNHADVADPRSDLAGQGRAELVEKALQAGGEDNVTVVLIENDGLDGREEAPA